jgi:SAM-dependent methyltransferase
MRAAQSAVAREPSPEPTRESRLICVLCRNAVAGDDPRGCTRCRNVMSGASEYPDVGGVKVMIPGGGALLAAIHERLVAERARFDAAAETPPTLFGAAPERTARRYRVLRHGERANLELLERHCAPVAEYLGEERTILSGLSGALAVRHAGASATWPLRYFHQDWAKTESFSAMLRRVRNAVATRANDRGAVAVLGCGAGGLVHGLSDLFDLAIGVDASVPTLLLARSVLDGGELSFAIHPERHMLSGAPRLTIRGPKPAPTNVRLIAADAAALPFAAESLSCVVTQYLLGVVPDPARVIAEIQRVLSPGGIWIDYDPPFRLASDPAAFLGRTEEDLPDLLDAFGFSYVESRALRPEGVPLSPQSALHGAEPVAPRADMSLVHPILFFVGRRNSALATEAASAAFERFFSGDAAPLFALRPKLSQPTRFLLGEQRLADTSRVDSLFTIGSTQLDTIVPPVTNPPMMGALLHGYLQRMTGERTVEELVRELHIESSGLLGEEDLVLAVYLLRTHARIDLV